MSKTTMIITNESDYRKPEEGIFRYSNKQWLANPTKIEGFVFGDVIVRCLLDEGLRDWLHMHLSIRIDRIIYESPLPRK